jgi:dTMP kinase
MPRAPFFSLDGLDGSGKSTQGRLLVEWLRGRGIPALACHDPGGTPLGEEIRALLLDQPRDMTLACEMFLFMASRAQLTAQVIQPSLAANQVVVADRFLLANVVYQGHAGGLDPAQLWEIGRLATSGLEPDLTFVLDLPVEQARLRRPGPADRMESRDASFHARVRQGYLLEAQRRPDRIRIIDAGRPVQVVHQEICADVAKFIDNPR